MKADKDFPHEQLTYLVIGILYDVYNDLGFGHPERVYQRAVVEGLKGKGIRFKRENIYKISYHGQPVGRYFYDFLIEDKVILEMKVGNDFYPAHLRQLLAYLRSSKLRLGLVSIFSNKGVMIKRIVNPDLRPSA